MHATGDKQQSGGDLSFQGGHNAAYAHASGKKNDMDVHSGPPMDPNLPRRESAQGSYVRQDQAPYRLDLLQTDPNLESGAPLQSDSAEQGTQSAFSSNHRPCDACLPLFVQLDRRARG